MVIVKLVVELICLETMNEGQYPDKRLNLEPLAFAH